MGVGLGLVAAGMALIFGAARRHRRAEPCLDGTEVEIDAAPRLVILGAVNDVNIVAGEGPRIRARVLDGPSAAGAVFLRRSDDGRQVHLNLHPRCRVDVAVPRGTAVRLQLAKSSVVATGIDDVDVLSAKGSLLLRDVGGTIRIRSAQESVDIDLSRERETCSVDVQIAKTRFALCLPASRGGKYRIESAKTSVTAPPSVEGGIPITVRAARAQVAIRAA